MKKKKGNDGNKVTKSHARIGKQTTYLCMVCEVVLCKTCDKVFHNEEKLNLPPCWKGKNKEFLQQCQPVITDKNSESDVIIEKN